MTRSKLVLKTAAAGRSSGEDDFTSSILLILFNCTSHVLFKSLPLIKNIHGGSGEGEMRLNSGRVTTLPQTTRPPQTHFIPIN